MKNLFNGIAVIIDDEIGDSKAAITNIINQIEKENIPTLKYTSLPEDSVVAHFQNLSFLLLDWNLINKNIINGQIEKGVKISDSLLKNNNMENIKFIKKINENCFCPIFIFTNEPVDDIENELIKNNIILENCFNNIFIKPKNELTGKAKLFRVLEKWLENNPSTYVFKKWEKEHQDAKNNLFNEFQKISPMWPKILWKNYKDDEIDPSLGLGEFITQNLHTRMYPFKFSEAILKKRGKKISTIEIQKVLEGEIFLENIENNNIAPGDIFKISSNYFVNIRAACDVIPRKNTNESIDDIELYLIKGSKVSNSKGKKLYQKQYGKFNELDIQSIVFPINNGKIIDFRFKNFEIIKWGEIKEKRIGRILPPVITRIQQRYALYMQRQGLPRIPGAAIFD